MMFLFIFNFSDNAILSDCESSIIDRGPGSNCDTNNMDIWWYWRQYIISPSCDPPWSCLTFSLFQSFRSLLHASLSLLFFVQSQHQRLSPCIDCVIYVAVGLVAESSKYAKSRQNAIYRPGQTTWIKLQLASCSIYSSGLDRSVIPKMSQPGPVNSCSFSL